MTWYSFGVNTCLLPPSTMRYTTDACRCHVTHPGGRGTVCLGRAQVEVRQLSEETKIVAGTVGMEYGPCIVKASVVNDGKKYP